MPVFGYQCSYKAHVKFDRLVKSPEDPVRCECGDRDCKPFRQLAAPAAHFKGTGFYQTDYKHK